MGLKEREIKTDQGIHSQRETGRRKEKGLERRRNIDTNPRREGQIERWRKGGTER